MSEYDNSSRLTILEDVLRKRNIEIEDLREKLKKADKEYIELKRDYETMKKRLVAWRVHN